MTNLLLKYYMFFVLFVFFYSCSNDKSFVKDLHNYSEFDSLNNELNYKELTYKLYNSEYLAKSLELKDTNYLKDYLHSLKSPVITDEEFFHRLSILADHTSFVFGMQDVSNVNSSYFKSNNYKKELYRKNVIQVYEIYMFECCGMIKGSEYEIGYNSKFQDWYKAEKVFDLYEEDLSTITIVYAIDSLVCNN